MKTCFSGGKLRKQFGNPPFLRELPITNPPISEQFFNDPSLCPNFKNTLHNFWAHKNWCTNFDKLTKNKIITMPFTNVFLVIIDDFLHFNIS